jgi:hypothetical protein
MWVAAAIERIELSGHFGEVEAGRKMRPLAGQHDGADVLGQMTEEGLESSHGHIVERIALLRP